MDDGAGERIDQSERSVTELETFTPASASSSVDPAATGDVPRLPTRSRQRYELLGAHAEGGLGRISRARDRDLGRTLAIKEIKVHDADAERRFVREALITARLEHPAIVPVHEAGRWESGEPFYAMKLVSGRTLKEAVRDKRTLAERLSLLPSVIAVADAVAYAHDRGIIHRDLKVSNVLVGDYGETLVIDWGLAKDVSAAGDPAASAGGPHRVHAELTAVGTVVGTPAFMPPEQARGEEVDARADVYALGALLYYVLGARPPHEGVSSKEVLARARAETPRPISEIVPEVPRDLAAIVEKAMARAPTNRYPSAKELAEDLKRFQTGQIVSARAYSAFQLALRWMERHRTIAATTAVFLVLSVAGLSAYLASEQRLRRAAETERDRAEASTLALLEKHGRDQLAAGRPFQASVYLAEALRRKPESRALRWLLTQAVRPLEAHEREIVGHEHDVPSVAYSPDGQLVVTASTDKTARVFRPGTGEQLAVLRGHEKFVDSAAFSPDARLVVTGSGDKTIRVFDARTGALVRRFEDPDPYRVAFSPDGALIITGSQTGEIRFRDATSGEILTRSSLHKDRPHALAFSPDGKRLLVGSWDRTASEWDLSTRTPIRTITDHSSEVCSVAYSQDGAWLLTVEEDVYLHVRHASTGERAYTLRLPEGARMSMASFAPDGRTLIVRSHDGGVRIYHTTSGALLWAIDAQPFGKLFASALRPDGDELVTAGLGGVLHVWRLDRARGYRILDHGAGRRAHVLPSTFTPDGSRIVTIDDGGRLAIWDVASGEQLDSLEVPAYAFSVATNADGSRVAASGVLKDAFPPRLWDLASATPLRALEGHTKMVYNLARSLDGDLIATASYDGSVRLFDADTAAPLGAHEVEKLRLSAVAISPDGEEIAVTNENGLLYLFDRSTWEVRRKIAAHTTWVQDVEYSRDGRLILTSGRQDHTARVWDRATGELVATLAGHKDNLMFGTFNPDASLVATASMDQTAHVWDVQSGEVLRTIPGPSYTAAFRSDGSELLTTGYFGYAVLWDMRIDERRAEDLAAFVAETSPWKLVDGRLVLPAATGAHP